MLIDNDPSDEEAFNKGLQAAEDYRTKAEQFCSEFCIKLLIVSKSKEEVDPKSAEGKKLKKLSTKFDGMLDANAQALQSKELLVQMFDAITKERP